MDHQAFNGCQVGTRADVCRGSLDHRETELIVVVVLVFVLVPFRPEGFIDEVRDTPTRNFP
ncbi:hypothetical protein D3C78_1917290 [compost metagenome]